MRRVILLSILLVLLLFVVAAYSVAITLSSDDIARLGGTSNVAVYCPTSGSECKIDKVTWSITSTPPYRVQGVNIRWTPATSSGQYMVYVTLYDNSGSNVVASGSATQSGSSSQVTTTITFSQPVDPATVYYVQIVIVQTS